jgi:broad specificity phosphatase PhoE
MVYLRLSSLLVLGDAIAPTESFALLNASPRQTTVSWPVSTTMVEGEPDPAETQQGVSGIDPKRRDTNKIIYGIRHAQSISNEYMSKEGNGWGDPTYLDNLSFCDSPISDTGRSQVELLRESLHKDGHWLSEIELVIVSPLTRCLQTFEYGCREALQARFHPLSPPKVLALALATERLYTAAETGRPVKDVEEEFPQVCWSMLKDLKNDEAWWFSGAHDAEEWRPYGQGQWYAVPGEPESVFEERMAALKEWLQQRPEQKILMVSHWGVLNHLTGQDLGNCEVCRFEFGPNKD